TSYNFGRMLIKKFFIFAEIPLIVKTKPVNSYNCPLPPSARYYNSDLSIWISVDPLSDKYPNLSPYTYCADNPVKFFDDDGREKIDALTNTEQNKRHKNACQRYPENDGVIHLWAHGSENSINLSGVIKNEVKDIVEYLYFTSKTYKKNVDEGKTSILVLHSCKTGKGDENIAQKISSESNLLVIAPTENVHIAVADFGKSWETDIECGTYEGSTYPVMGKEIHRDITRNGYWKIYYKGVVVDSFNGLTKPIFNDPQAIIEKYEKIYQQKTSEAGQ
ncbi:MAG: hypothetical protein IJT51_06475, partial [Bacteroidales bacterium]|nr:hypothetical protein [Bacteroidales bacterium]